MSDDLHSDAERRILEIGVAQYLDHKITLRQLALAVFPDWSHDEIRQAILDGIDRRRVQAERRFVN